MVHPIQDKGRCFLPCTYGYATTIRRAQGGTYTHGCIYFDHSRPPASGYGYVAVSRFRSKGGIYLYGKVRRTDWRPVRTDRDAMKHDQVDRSEESMSEHDSSDDEAYYRVQDDGSESGDDDDYDGYNLPDGISADYVYEWDAARVEGGAPI